MELGRLRKVNVSLQLPKHYITPLFSIQWYCSILEQCPLVGDLIMLYRSPHTHQELQGLCEVTDWKATICNFTKYSTILD